MTEDTAIPYLQIYPDDNVLVALKDLSSGTSFSLENGQLTLPQAVAAKHKFFVNEMISYLKKRFVNTGWLRWRR